MSDVMLHGVLRMPPELWGNGPIDITARHGRYIEASDRIIELERERDAWHSMATELADAAAYGLAQWDDGYTLEASRKIGESIMRFQKMAKEAAK